MMVNTAAIQNADAPRYIPKPRPQWMPGNRKRNNLDKIVKDILFKAVDDMIFPRIIKCETTKQIWEVLFQFGEEDQQQKENNLTIAMNKFEHLKMVNGELIRDMRHGS